MWSQVKNCGTAADVMPATQRRLVADLKRLDGNASVVGNEQGVIEIDKNICCFATGRLYTEALLGVGVSREKRNLSTAAELLSKEAFDGGLRQSTNKSPFEFFLPVWINELHAAQSRTWRESLRSSYMEMGFKVFQVNGEDEAIIEVFPRLINQMIVEVTKPDAAKSAAIATFEAMCNFWRTFRWLVETRPTLLKRIGAMLSKFVLEETSRHKDTTPDLGVALVLFTVLQGYKDCPTRASFISAYAEENALRQSIDSWSSYLRRIGFSRPSSQSETAWIADVIRAAAKGSSDRKGQR